MAMVIMLSRGIANMLKNDVKYMLLYKGKFFPNRIIPKGSRYS
jgi:hypothetical protein